MAIIFRKMLKWAPSLALAFTGPIKINAMLETKIFGYKIKYKGFIKILKGDSKMDWEERIGKIAEQILEYLGGKRKEFEFKLDGVSLKAGKFLIEFDGTITIKPEKES